MVYYTSSASIYPVDYAETHLYNDPLLGCSLLVGVFDDKGVQKTGV